LGAPADADRLRVLAIDAGGTMTDTFVVDGRGAFVVGKAQTTPEDESAGFMASARDALAQRDTTPAEAFPRIVSGIYSGTAMLNRLLAREGRRIGAIVSAGQEDYLQLERGIQTYLGYSYADRLHVATHCPNCARQLEVEAAPPGYPLVHDFLPDVEGFYRGWLGRELP
jgi:acetone carboxylase, beta subunit